MNRRAFLQTLAAAAAAIAAPRAVAGAFEPAAVFIGVDPALPGSESTSFICAVRSMSVTMHHDAPMLVGLSPRLERVQAARAAGSTLDMELLLNSESTLFVQEMMTRVGDSLIDRDWFKKHGVQHPLRDILDMWPEDLKFRIEELTVEAGPGALTARIKAEEVQS